MVNLPGDRSGRAAQAISAQKMQGGSRPTTIRAASASERSTPDDVTPALAISAQPYGGVAHLISEAVRWGTRILCTERCKLNPSTFVLKQIKKQIEELLESPKSPLVSFKGIGPVTAAAIHGETLSIERFATADRFARYDGTAPREDSSGRKPKQVKNRRCNKRLRQAFMQLALNAPRYHVASKAYQKHLESCGITGGAARVRLARRLSDIIFAMLRDRREYNLEYYMTHKKSAA